ncbi:response regulator [Haliovirga abyssi]|uniref:Response regulatory domain-containing protein n=1 Tax=Haliovirga abyssi TaxID=2996794 RepID=A0AAU9DP51_9FUSO|nr:response regulator [Haliovirga abyssi]BDU50173.1 hypothetical protein HLVA_07420 [Haliovirga abyssi]
MSKNILIVDDEVDVVEVIEMLLKNQGYNVITAHNGIEALERIEKKIPDLVILDIMMPQMDGLEACKKMRENEKMENVPIVMFSAKLSAVDKKEAFEVGADGFITKPFNARGFIAGIRTYLELGHM